MLSNKFSCSGSEYFGYKGHLIKRLVLFDNTVDNMLAEADHQAHTANVGITVNHTNQCADPLPFRERP